MRERRPVAVTSGIDSATASDTAPRGPHQANTTRSCRVMPAAISSRTGSRCKAGATSSTQAMRTPTAATTTAAAAAANSHTGYSMSLDDRGHLHAQQHE